MRRLLSSHCLLCSGTSYGQTLCVYCVGSLPRLASSHCDTCALPITEGARCGACISHPPLFDHVCAPWEYAFPANALVRALKYRGLLAVAPLLGDALAQSLDSRPDVLIPMPLTPTRLAERGFNHAHEIARRVSKATGIPLAANACRKVRDTAPQAALPWKERAKNVRRAFVCDGDFTGQHVGVVDDVMTTGATLNEISRNLKQAGATRVTGLIAARTLPSLHRGNSSDV